MDIPVLKVEARHELGKESAGRLRHQNKIPATCYGASKTPLSIACCPAELKTILAGPRGMNTLIKLQGAEEERTVFVQSYQIDPLSRNVLHVDFLNIDTSERIRREVPVELTGKPEGVKAGGVLQILRRTILVESLPEQLPERVLIDVEPLLIGQAIHVNKVSLPEGVNAVFEHNFTICAVVAPTVEKEETPADAAAKELEGEAAPGTTPTAEGEKGADEKKASSDKVPDGGASGKK